MVRVPDSRSEVLSLDDYVQLPYSWNITERGVHNHQTNYDKLEMHRAPSSDAFAWEEHLAYNLQVSQTIIKAFFTKRHLGRLIVNDHVFTALVYKIVKVYAYEPF